MEIKVGQKIFFYWEDECQVYEMEVTEYKRYEGCCVTKIHTENNYFDDCIEYSNHYECFVDGTTVRIYDNKEDAMAMAMGQAYSNCYVMMWSAKANGMGEEFIEIVTEHFKEILNSK